MLTTLAMALLCGSAPKQDLGSAPHDQEISSGWTMSFALENDLFNNGDDRDYTNGALVSITTPEIHVPGYGLMTQLPLLKDYKLIGDFSVTQAMYTPNDLSAEPPDPTDRPYAGVLLGNLSVIGVAPTGDRRAYFTLSLGVIGPDSGAEWTQKFVHRHVGASPPHGWDHQINRALVGGARYEQGYVYSPFTQRSAHWSFSLEPDWVVQVGNMRTEAAAGAVVRLGYDAPADLGVPRVAAATPGSGYFETTHLLGGYVFAGAHQHYVAYDVTLDRAPTDNGPGVNRIDWVTDAEVGAVLALGHLRLSYTHEFLTKEFRGQERNHGFGAVSLSINFGGQAFLRDRSD